MRHVSDDSRLPAIQHGFTLVEMIISIVIAGIVVAMVSLFGRNQIEAYIDVGNRAELADAADTALRRIARDLQGGLPNSVRESGGAFLEFVPVHDAGRYRADVDNAGAGDFLDFSSTTDDSFDVLGPSVTITAGDQLVVYNLGVPGSNVYDNDSSRRPITTAPGTVSNIRYQLGAAPNQQFVLPSPLNRFHLVGAPVTYQCVPNAANPELGVILRHTGYGFNAAQPLAFAGGAVLVNNVAACAFMYSQAVLQRNGLVVLRLTLTRNGESVQLLHQVEVLNKP